MILLPVGLLALAALVACGPTLPVKAPPVWAMAAEFQAPAALGTQPSEPRAQNLTKIAGVVTASVGIVAASGSIVAGGGGNLLGRGYRSIQQTSDGAATSDALVGRPHPVDPPLAGAEVYLADAKGRPLLGFDPTRTDAVGRYGFSDVLMGQPVVVAVRIRGRNQETATLQTIVTPGEAESRADVSVWTTMVAAYVLESRPDGDVGSFDPDAFAKAVEKIDARRGEIAGQDLSDPLVLSKSVAAMVKADPGLLNVLEAVRRDTTTGVPPPQPGDPGAIQRSDLPAAKVPQPQADVSQRNGDGGGWVGRDEDAPAGITAEVTFTDGPHVTVTPTPLPLILP